MISDDEGGKSGLVDDSQSLTPSLASTMTDNDDAVLSLTVARMKFDSTNLDGGEQTNNTLRIQGISIRQVPSADNARGELVGTQSIVNNGRAEESFATGVSSQLSPIHKYIVHENQDELLYQAIIESQVQARLAEQTSREMEQVVDWWSKHEEKEQEEALPGNMLANHTDWLTQTECSTAAFCMTSAPKSREVALEQAFLVDMVVGRTNEMSALVRELQTQEATEINQEVADVEKPKTETVRFSRKGNAKPMIVLCLVLVLFMTIMLSFLLSSPTSSTSTTLLVYQDIHMDHICKIADEIWHVEDGLELIVNNGDICHAWGPMALPVAR